LNGHGPYKVAGRKPVAAKPATLAKRIFAKPEVFAKKAVATAVGQDRQASA
jgi:hypothetical protein